jgi:cytoskeletal protein CcmA (bactofilin family)
MFGNKRVPVFTDQVETIVGQDTQIKGTITAGGTIRIDGHVEGEVSARGDIVIGETGIVKAQIKARSATIAGSLTGNADVENKLELTPSGKIFGDIKTGILIIGEGAVFKGACEMRQGGDNEGKFKEPKIDPAKT